MATNEFTVSFEPAPLETRVAELEHHVSTLYVQMVEVVRFLNELSVALAGDTQDAPEVLAPSLIIPS